MYTIGGRFWPVMKYLSNFYQWWI